MKKNWKNLIGTWQLTHVAGQKVEVDPEHGPCLYTFSEKSFMVQESSLRRRKRTLYVYHAECDALQTRNSVVFVHHLTKNHLAIEEVPWNNGQEVERVWKRLYRIR